MIHVLRPNNPRFLVRVRKLGYRTYEIVGKGKTTKQEAMNALMKKLSSGKYKRGDILMVTNDYYGPSVVCEVVIN